MGSADWMPRNFFKRIEVVFPVESGVLRDRIIRELLALTNADNVKARFLGPRGAYALAERPANAKKHRSQVEFMKLSRSPASEKKTTRKGNEKKTYPRVKLAPKSAAD